MSGNDPLTIALAGRKSPVAHVVLGLSRRYIQGPPRLEPLSLIGQRLILIVVSSCTASEAKDPEFMNGAPCVFDSADAEADCRAALVSMTLENSQALEGGSRAAAGPAPKRFA
jgi:hypothetical protein